jgi:carbonic anhydrase
MRVRREQSFSGAVCRIRACMAALVTCYDRRVALHHCTTYHPADHVVVTHPCGLVTWRQHFGDVAMRIRA